MGERRRAFFTSPFDEPFRWIRNGVATACRELDLDFRPVDEMVVPGTSIVTAIHYEIAQCTLAFVVISRLNPNVLYELGLLHAASKPTVILCDKETFPQVPFDLRSLMIVRYDAAAEDERELSTVVIAATSRLLRLLDDPSSRQAVAAGTTAPLQLPTTTTVQLTIAQYDFESLKDRAAGSVGRKNCTTSNISEYDDELKGWRLKARCRDGAVITVIIDVNGDIREIDVQD